MYEKTFRKLNVVLSALVSVFLVAGAVMATTTIGTGISNDSAVTTGIALTGTYTSGIKLGTSSVPLDLTSTSANRAIEVYTTSSSTDGTTVKPIYMKSIMTGSGGTGGRAEFELSVGAVTLGGYANALKGITNFTGLTGGTAGLASAINAELNMPNGAASGAYFPLEINYVDDTLTNITPIGSTAGFIYMNATVTGDFNTDGYFMKVDGLTAGASKLLSLTSQTLRSSIGASSAGNRYLVLSQLEDGLGLGVSATPMVLASYANKAVGVYTTSASADGSNSVEPFFVRSTMTAAGGVGGRSRFELVVNGVKLGGFANALKAYADFSAAGSGTTGLGSALVAELKMPDGTAYGAYFPLEIEYVDQGSTAITPIGSTAGFIYMAASGTKTDFDDDGYFMKVDGLTPLLNHMASLTSQTLRMNIGTGAGLTRYLVLSQLQDGLGLGNSSAPMVLGTTATAKAIEIYTTSSSTTGGTYVEPIYMKNIMTGAGGSGGRARFENVVQAQMAIGTSALKGFLNFSSAGSTTGLASAIVAEMNMPDAAITAPGNYALLELELTCPSSWSGNNVVSLLYTNVTGTNKANFDTYGVVLNLNGIAAGSGKLYDETASTATGDGTLKIVIGGVTKYLLVADDPN